MVGIGSYFFGDLTHLNRKVLLCIWVFLRGDYQIAEGSLAYEGCWVIMVVLATNFSNKKAP